ncbi:MAG: hypothetical protein U5R49_05605 [Deltaproteobacteria bacterium]|nr:hypothetical protein [Deltaproteobacteria bacterium]
MRSKPPDTPARPTMPRAVLDTHVLVSGVIALGYSAEIPDAARHETIQLLTSKHSLDLKSHRGIPILTPRPGRGRPFFTKKQGVYWKGPGQEG